MAPPPTVVLLHGFGSTFDHNWLRSGWVDILADCGCEVPPIDLPGHGTSEPLTDPAAYADVEGALSARLPVPTVAVGFSAGGQILLRMAVAHPERFERIVLLGVGDNVFARSDSAALATALEGEPDPTDVQAGVFLRLARTTGNHPPALAAFLRRPVEPLRPEDVAGVTCPVLVVLGERDLVPTAERLVAALPDASLVTVPGADHFALPADFTTIDATLSFLGCT
jgi:pimeloyl-ACP methyl ester carboxylesterase